MKSYIDWYSGQLVTAADLDAGTVDGPEATEQAMNIDGGQAQASSTDTPGPTIYGGIVKGLDLVTAPSPAGQDYVTVTAGAARDEQGRTVELPSGGATVMITRTGATPIGDASMATNTSGADISLSCPSGDYIVASLFIVYAQALTNQVQNEAGTWVYKNVDESFRFDLQIGSSFTPGAEPVAAPFASLADGKVLLADILLENSGGNMQVKTIHTTSKSWDDLGGNYVQWSGRRSDWLSAEIDDAVLPLQAPVGNLRASSPRAFLYSLLQKLQDSGTGTNGAEMIGNESRSESLVNNPAQAISLASGSISSQITSIIRSLASTMHRGGNNTLAPQSGYNGIIADPTSMDADATLYGVKALGDAATYNLFRIGKLRGHVALPDLLNEHWTGYMGADNGLGYTVMPTTFGPWTNTTGGPGGTDIYMSRSHPGGALNLTAMQGGGNIELLYGQDDAGNISIGWHAHQAPYFCASFRFRLSHVAATQCLYQIGMFDEAGGNSRVAFFNNGSSIMCYAYDSAGVGVEDTLVTTALVDTWYTGRITVVGPRKAILQVNNGAEVTLTLSSDFSGGLHVPRVYIADNDGTTDNTLTIGQVQVWNTQLGSDQI